MKLDIERAARDGWATLRAHREAVIPIVGLFVFLPAAAVSVFLPLQVPPAATPEQLLVAFELYLRGNLLWLLISGVLAAFANATILSLLLHRDAPTVGEALRRGLAMAPALYAFSLIANVVIGMGLALLIVPGIYLLGRLALGPAMMVAERRMNPIWGLAASWTATAGNGWRIALLLAMLFLAGTTVGLALGSLVGVVAGAAGGAEAVRPAGTIASSAISAIAGLLILMVRAAAWRQLAGDSKGI